MQAHWKRYLINFANNHESNNLLGFFFECRKNYLKEVYKMFIQYINLRKIEYLFHLYAEESLNIGKNLKSVWSFSFKLVLVYFAVWILAQLTSNVLDIFLFEIHNSNKTVILPFLHPSVAAPYRIQPYPWIPYLTISKDTVGYGRRLYGTVTVTATLGCKNRKNYCIIWSDFHNIFHCGYIKMII